MITKLGEKFTTLFLKYMPNAFVFAILLTLLVALSAFFWIDASPINIITSWYDGFFDLLGFAMQIVLIIITGFSIALSPIVKKGIEHRVSSTKECKIMLIENKTTAHTGNVNSDITKSISQQLP